ncbi:hypothetical protein [Segetibacter koreensis]|uniref:hypothetical protein n=1 Tax=Segetibacter koreensis TaxID=398037 RepID=UPI00035DE3B2|nr:hypothetical protein [Segetibacter koreensis]
MNEMRRNDDAMIKQRQVSKKITMDEEKTQMNKAKPEVIPEGTYMPFLLAVSLLFMGWGLISYWIMSVAGTIGFFIALAGWIKEMYERGQD